MMQSIRCSGCEFKRDVYFLNRVYDVGRLDGGLPVLANLGWCFACHDCVAVEFVPDLTQLVEDLALERRQAVARQPDDESPNNHLVWAESRLHWRERRNSPARCLTCGSTDIHELMNRYQSRKGDILGEHPTCFDAGKLLLDGIGFVNYLSVTVYNAEGSGRSILQTSSNGASASSRVGCRLFNGKSIDVAIVNAVVCIRSAIEQL